MKLKNFYYLCSLIAISFTIVGCSSPHPKHKTSDVFYDTGASSYGHYLAGKYAYIKGDFDVAAQFMDQAIDIAPHEKTLLQSTYLTHIAQGDVKKAIQYVQKLIKNDQADEFAYMISLVNFIQKGQYKDGLKLIAQYQDKLEPFASIVPLIKLWLHAGLKEALPVAEVTEFAQMMTIPQTYDYHIGLVYEFLNDPKKAEEYYRKASNPIESMSYRLIEIIGGFFERIANLEQAKNIYNNAQDKENEFFIYETFQSRLKEKIAPNFDIHNAQEGIAEVLTQFASSYLSMNMYDSSLLFIQLSLYLRPNFPLAQMVLASILMDQKNYSKALQHYKNFSSVSPFYWLGQMKQAEILVETKKTKDAFLLLDAMSVSKPNWASPFLLRANTLRSKKKYAEAILFYNKAIDVLEKMTQKTNLWHAYFLRGVCHEMNKDWPKAEKDLEKSIQLRDNYPLSLNYLGFLWVDKGVFLEKGLDLIKKAVALTPDDGAIVDSLGWAYFKLGQIALAQEHLEKAVLLTPNDPQIHDHLGDLYLKLGRVDEARYEWKKSLLFNPSEEEKIKTKDKLDALVL
ncbi:MAG: tetratricopeptide repeat protein [Alphaproteobacteria bacterium]|nr:tetratricopeptide repeat protein [Alphaproteobacteria bacterium]